MSSTESPRQPLLVFSMLTKTCFSEEQPISLFPAHEAFERRYASEIPDAIKKRLLPMLTSPLRPAAISTIRVSNVTGC